MKFPQDNYDDIRQEQKWELEAISSQTPDTDNQKSTAEQGTEIDNPLLDAVSYSDKQISKEVEKLSAKSSECGIIKTVENLSGKYISAR